MCWFTQYPLEHFLVLSAIIFCAGVYTILTRKNAVSILMGIELILNAANINFVAFSHYRGWGLKGDAFVVFVIVLAAAEAAVALAIIIGMYRNLGSVDVDNANSMKE